MRLWIRNGRVIDPANQVDGVQDLWIADGRVAAVGTAPAGFEAERSIDAAGLVVCPGLVDLGAHLREPGQEHKATIASETAAAAAGGITTLVFPPDTDPVVDTPAVANLVQRRAQAAGKARVLTLGALTQGLKCAQISEMGALKEAGCVGMSNARRPIANTLVMRRAMEYAATHDLTVFLHAEDPWLSNHGSMHEGRVSTRLGLAGIPEATETVAVARDLALVQQTGVRAHFCRLSTAQAVRMVARAQYDGLPVTADVSAHHLHLTEIDVGNFDSQCHVLPPLRTQRDRDGLRSGLAQGTLLAVCSDHQPHEADAKLAPFAATAAGISALDTLLPLSLRLVEDGALSLPELIARLTCRPAQLLGTKLGTLGVGTVADLCLFDPNEEWEFAAAHMHSRGHNTPFLGWQFKGRIVMTVFGGDVVFERAARTSAG
jgi:dihydroorotase